jgi:hypothetical protein
MSSALHLNSDIARSSRHFAFVPNSDMADVVRAKEKPPHGGSQLKPDDTQVGTSVTSSIRMSLFERCDVIGEIGDFCST